MFDYPEGATPIDEDEKEALLIPHITTLEELNEWEQRNITDAYSWLDSTRRKDILSEDFICTLHKKMFGKVWRWAGNYRQSDKNIGLDWTRIPVHLRQILKDVRYWVNHETYPSDEIATRFHHRLVLIHLFPNGNGRHTRVITDLLFLFRRSVYFIIILSMLLLGIISCSTESTPSYQLTTSSLPAEGGTVNPASGEFDEGDEVQIQATANQDWVFDVWEGDQTGTQNPVSFTMNSDKNITARFVKRQFPLTINVEGEGTVTETIVQPKMTDYDVGTVVELRANSGTGYEFNEWTGDIESTDNPVTVTMDGPKEITVVFEPMEFSVAIRAEGPGSVSIDPDKELYQYNETALFDAVPDPEHEFLGWFNETGSFEMLEAQFEYQITDNLDIAAFFSTVEDAFVIETVEINTADGVVNRVIFNVLNFLLDDVILAGAIISDEEGEEVAAIEFEGPPVLTGRSGAEVTITFEGEGIDENVISDWVFNWLFDYKGERYEKDQEIGEPESSAKQKQHSPNDVEIQKSFKIKIK